MTVNKKLISINSKIHPIILNNLLREKLGFLIPNNSLTIVHINNNIVVQNKAIEPDITEPIVNKSKRIIERIFLLFFLL